MLSTQCLLCIAGFAVSQTTQRRHAIHARRGHRCLLRSGCGRRLYMLHPAAAAAHGRQQMLMGIEGRLTGTRTKFEPVIPMNMLLTSA